MQAIAELKGWQPLMGAVLGFVTLTLGALYNYHLGRKRDDHIRQQEALTVALALYSEIDLLSRDVAALANGVGGWFLRHQYSAAVPASYRGLYHLREPALYRALAPKLGLLTPATLLPITRFYSNYEEASRYFPKLLSDHGDTESYGPEWVLRPAIDALDGVQAALRLIEEIGDVSPSAPPPAIDRARKALVLYEDMNEQP